MTAPLAGLRVLDFSRVLSGPYASMCLADLGADVVKIEDPKDGDDTRGFGPPFVDDVSTYFLSINRGKRSLTLNLKDPADRELALCLSALADVVLENFRPGVMDRLGLGPAALQAKNPRLIYCAISGFGQDWHGPDAGAPGVRGAPGYDLMVQGLSGIPSLSGEADGPPAKCAVSIADLVAGMNAVQAILAALYRRERTGEGARVDVPMLDGQLSLLTYHASAWLNAGRAPARLGNAHPSIHPFCTYRTRDGWLNLSVGNDRLFERLAEALHRPEWAADVRFESNAARVLNRAALDALLAPLLAERDTDALIAVLEEKGVPCGPMRTVPEALRQATLVEHPHPTSGNPVRSVPLPYRIDGAPRSTDRRAPRLGEHRAEVLSEWLGATEESAGEKTPANRP